MERIEQIRMAEEYALGFFLSERDGITYEQLMDSLANNVLPGGVTVWEPFEDYSCDSLIYFIENLRDEFLNFADRINKAN